MRSMGGLFVVLLISAVPAAFAQIGGHSAELAKGGLIIPSIQEVPANQPLTDSLSLMLTQFWVTPPEQSVPFLELMASGRDAATSPTPEQVSARLLLGIIGDPAAAREPDVRVRLQAMIGEQNVTLLEAAADQLQRLADKNSVIQDQLTRLQAHFALSKSDLDAIAPQTDPAAAKTAEAPAPYYRVWRGYRREDVPSAEFIKNIGTQFVPATKQWLEGNHGEFYLPVIPPADAPAGLPSELAIVGYSSQKEYEAARDTPEGKKYQDLHWTLFKSPGAETKSSGPVPFANSVEWDKAYDLTGRPVSWQTGHARFFLGKVKDVDILKPMAEILSNMRNQFVPRGLDGLIAVVDRNGYVAWWEHWKSKEDADGALTSTIGAALQAAIAEILRPVQWIDQQIYQGAMLPNTLANVSFAAGEPKDDFEEAKAKADKFGEYLTSLGQKIAARGYKEEAYTAVFGPRMSIEDLNKIIKDPKTGKAKSTILAFPSKVIFYEWTFLDLETGKLYQIRPQAAYGPLDLPEDVSIAGRFTPDQIKKLIDILHAEPDSV